MPPETEETAESGAEVAAGAAASAPNSGLWQVPGQPEREKRAEPPPGNQQPGNQPPGKQTPGKQTPGGTKQVRRRRRAERSGTNPSAEDLPDVVPPREDGGPGDSPHDRWLREQRPPHWE